MKNQNTIFAIGIPTINRADLLQETLEKYSKDFPNTAIHVLDNGMQSFEYDKLGPNIHFHVSPINKGVAASWNYLLNKIYEGHLNIKPCTNALILNDDIYLGKNENQIKEYIAKNNFGFATTTITWCVFLLNKLIYNKVGQFDEAFFPAYFEDNDYSYRLRLSGFEENADVFLNPEVYRNSQTIAKEPSLNNNFETNRQYFIKKWGGMPLQEIFFTPFNQL